MHARTRHRAPSTPNQIGWLRALLWFPSVRVPSTVVWAVASGVLAAAKALSLRSKSRDRRLGFSDEQIDQIFTTRVPRYRDIANAEADASDGDLVVPQE